MQWTSTVNDGTLVAAYATTVARLAISHETAEALDGSAFGVQQLMISWP